MIHGRDDYNARITDSAPGGIGKDEPVFLMRAKDEFAPHVLMDYAERCSLRGLHAMAQEVRAHAARMRQWQADHGCKLPDAPGRAAKAAAKPATA